LLLLNQQINYIGRINFSPEAQLGLNVNLEKIMIRNNTCLYVYLRVCMKVLMYI